MLSIANDNLLTIKETAEIFKTQESTIRSWIRRKNLPPELVFKLGGIVRIKKPLLEKFIGGEL